ncbi:MAG: amidase [Terracidiphilus sp.]|jgi:aspartyl-tRNA(Asn)/glutamyl-tRNA(Gln) amidotransferase subunit A
MFVGAGTIRDLRAALASGVLKPSQLVAEALSHCNSNAGRNTYLWQNEVWTLAEAERSESIPASTGGLFGDGRSPLWGLPISVKDCFDLAGAPTSCGTKFYRDLNGSAKRDSWLVEQLRKAGAVITGKTHLHPLAYGITGENPDFGDCVQPGNPTALTGGSSSGACASVLEGSAVAAIGTDTGGSIRVPAALCGLAGYRASLGRGDWRGGAHLAESFDTMGWLCRDLRDAPLLAFPFAPADAAPPRPFTRFAYVADSFLADSEPEVVAGFHAAIRELESLGLEGRAIDPDWWRESTEIYSPIQANEAARLHAGNFEHIQPGIRERLQWGASISSSEITALRKRCAEFCARMDELFATGELILMPCSPVAQLTAGADHSQTRMRLLRYTTPFSLCGVPAITIPCAHSGVQLAAPLGEDESLLALAAQIGEQSAAGVDRES